MALKSGIAKIACLPNAEVTIAMIVHNGKPLIMSNKNVYLMESDLTLKKIEIS